MIQITNIHKRFGSLEVLKGVSMELSRGELISVVGASGAGKTTLLQIIGTLSRADEGEVVIDGVALSSLDEHALARFRNQQIGFVFQFHQLLPEFTALENVSLPALIGGMGREEAEARAVALLERVKLMPRAHHKPSQLSGGEQQRVAIARALINRPALVLADEPSGNLDSRNREEIHRLFFELREELQQTMLIVTHDERLAATTDRCIELVDGQIRK